MDQSFLEAANAVAVAAACLRLWEDNRWIVMIQPSVLMETCGYVEVQEDRVGHPSSEGQGMDRDSGLELEGGKR